jgi:hypothetical protein
MQAQRYFFDLRGESHILYDYSGRWLQQLEAAKELAEMIALDVACGLNSSPELREVQVRGATGNHLLSVTIPNQASVAA